MTRTLTAVQPLPGDRRYADTLRADPGTWLPGARAQGLDSWLVTLAVGAVERPVLCTVGAPWSTADGLLRTIAWDPVTIEADVVAAGHWLPSFDGELYLVGDGEAPSLVLLGEVEPPLGRLGDAVDAVLLRRLGDRGANAFLRELAEQFVEAPTTEHHGPDLAGLAG